MSLPGWPVSVESWVSWIIFVRSGSCWGIQIFSLRQSRCPSSIEHSDKVIGNPHCDGRRLGNTSCNYSTFIVFKSTKRGLRRLIEISLLLHHRPSVIMY